MKTIFSAGDVVVSTAGRDKGKRFLVVRICDGYAFITDGRTHKVNRLKKKNFKHLEPAKCGNLTETAARINRGECVGNDKVYKFLSIN